MAAKRSLGEDLGWVFLFFASLIGLVTTVVWANVAPDEFPEIRLPDVASWFPKSEPKSNSRANSNRSPRQNSRTAANAGVSARSNPPIRVAFLLPKTGTQAGNAEAMRRGFIAGFPTEFVMNKRRVEVVYRDIAGPRNVLAARVLEAIADESCALLVAPPDRDITESIMEFAGEKRMPVLSPLPVGEETAIPLALAPTLVQIGTGDALPTQAEIWTGAALEILSRNDRPSETVCLIADREMLAARPLQAMRDNLREAEWNTHTIGVSDSSESIADAIREVVRDMPRLIVLACQDWGIAEDFLADGSRYFNTRTKILIVGPIGSTSRYTVRLALSRADVFGIAPDARVQEKFSDAFHEMYRRHFFRRPSSDFERAGFDTARIAEWVLRQTAARNADFTREEVTAHLADLGGAECAAGQIFRLSNGTLIRNTHAMRLTRDGLQFMESTPR